jgi:crotonobetainyl-CoA:carnitine CoA-transferase CaiB-like acyl-CoA transferase
MPAAALDGLRVLDLTSGTFNYAGKLLAGFGADVVKVEPPGGDPIRYQAPFVTGEEDLELSGRHLHMNTGKRSVVLNLDDAADQGRLVGLLKDYDIMIESYPPGYLAARGLGYQTLSQARGDLIYASISFFGQDGPYAHYAGAEIVAEALSGYLRLTGDPDREPVKSYDNLAEQQTALQAAVAIMTAVTQRELTGEGDYLDLAVFEAAMFLLGGPAQLYISTGIVAKRNGTRLLGMSPEVFYPSCIRPCKGGYVHVHTNTRHPDLMGTLMGVPELNDLEIMATPMGHADKIDELMDRWLSQHDKFEVVEMAQAMRLPFTEVLTPLELINDSHLQARGFFQEVEHPRAGVIRQPGAPGMMTGTPWVTRRAPLLGEHQEEVLGAKDASSR